MDLRNVTPLMTSFLLDGGRPGWWCEQGGEERTKVGADLGVLRRRGGLTTTQPSSIEEEGYAFEKPAPDFQTIAGSDRFRTTPRKSPA